MKKFIVAVVLAASLAAVCPVFAQEEEEKEKGKGSEYYYYNIAIEKIWPYRKGYIVQYRKGLNQFARAYLPSEWFTNTAAKGEIITLPHGRAWPSMTVYYKSGEFSHVRLYVHASRTHQTWGIIPQNVNIDSNFEDVEDLKLQF